MVARNTTNNRQPPMIAGINVTPLVDVVLVLLVILMVASTYIVSQSIKVDLPRASSTDGKVDSPAVVTLLLDGSVRLNDKPIDPAAVKPALESLLRADPELPVVISADRAVQHWLVVQYVDWAKLAGAKRFALTVQKSL